LGSDPVMAHLDDPSPLAPVVGLFHQRLGPGAPVSPARPQSHRAPRRSGPI